MNEFAMTIVACARAIIEGRTQIETALNDLHYLYPAKGRTILRLTLVDTIVELESELANNEKNA